MKYFAAIILFLLSNQIIAQTGTAEDKLHKDSATFLSRTTIGGYGNAIYSRDFNLESSTVNLERFVLFVGHKLSDRISFFSELELEDAKVEGEEEGGEIALEQCYLKFNLSKNVYLVGGLFLPRIGILNENHLPTSFNGNQRTLVETYVIPSTWRELGVGLFGSLRFTPLSYSLSVMNGLNSAGFEHGTLIREGRFEGKDATANNLALNASVQYDYRNFKFQVSGYFGGSVGLNSRQSDSLQLTSGMFGTPVALGEANIQYSANGLTVKVLGTIVSIPDAGEINRAYANNTPSAAYGYYAEVGYNLLEKSANSKERQLIVFGRYEKLDLNSEIPLNGIIDGTLNQQHVFLGLTYLPIKYVAIKADVRLMETEDANPALLINASPNAIPYQTENTFLNLGIGYSF